MPHPMSIYTRLHRAAARFWVAKRAVAAVEFALVTPFLIALLLGSYELTRYINSTRQVAALSNSIAQLFVQNTSGTVDDVDLHFAFDSTMIAFPAVLSDAAQKGVLWWLDISITMSGITFVPTVAGCTTNCIYNAQVMWSTGSRPCSVNLSKVDDNATPSPTTLPADVFGPGSLIAVDIVYTYRSLLASALFGPRTITRSTFLQPRYVDSVKYRTSAGNWASSCPGMN